MLGWLKNEARCLIVVVYIYTCLYFFEGIPRKFTNLPVPKTEIQRDPWCYPPLELVIGLEGGLGSKGVFTGKAFLGILINS